MPGSDDTASMPFAEPAATPLRCNVVPPGPQVTQTSSNPVAGRASTRSPDWPSFRRIACSRPPGSGIRPSPCLPTSESSQPSRRWPDRPSSAVRKTTNRLPVGGTVRGNSSRDWPSNRSTAFVRPLIVAVVLTGPLRWSAGLASAGTPDRFGQSRTRPSRNRRGDADRRPASGCTQASRTDPVSRMNRRIRTRCARLARRAPCWRSSAPRPSAEPASVPAAASRRIG